MKISVIIPAYNSSRTIRTTLESAFAQVRPADEILVMDDGSTDNTADIVRSFGSRITLLSQPNAGCAEARNALCRVAQGDLLAFLDADDSWHPSYLRAQTQNFEKFPDAAAFYTWHVTVSGAEGYDWGPGAPLESYTAERIPALTFLHTYNEAPGKFAISASCAPKTIVARMGAQPFRQRAAEDWYFYNLLTLFGDVIYFPAELATYRTQAGSLSAEPLKLSKAIVEGGELLLPTFQQFPDKRYLRVFLDALSLKQRVFAKVLLYRGDTAKARYYLRQSAKNSSAPKSVAKSLAMLFFTYLPKQMQPDWLANFANWKGPRYS